MCFKSRRPHQLRVPLSACHEEESKNGWKMPSWRTVKKISRWFFPPNQARSPVVSRNDKRNSIRDVERSGMWCYTGFTAWRIFPRYCTYMKLTQDCHGESVTSHQVRFQALNKPDVVPFMIKASIVIALSSGGSIDVNIDVSINYGRCLGMWFGHVR